MRYILSITVLLFLFGCDNKVEDNTLGVTLEDTGALQPKVADKNLQPPTPPSIVVE